MPMREYAFLRGDLILINAMTTSTEEPESTRVLDPVSAKRVLNDRIIQHATNLA